MDHVLNHALIEEFQEKLQKDERTSEAFRCVKKELTREEYYRLLKAAKRKENREIA